MKSLNECHCHQGARPFFENGIWRSPVWPAGSKKPFQLIQPTKGKKEIKTLGCNGTVNPVTSFYQGHCSMLPHLFPQTNDGGFCKNQTTATDAHLA